MYNPRQKNNSFGKQNYQARPFNIGNSFGGKFKRRQYIDPVLFVKKAIAEDIAIIPTNSTALFSDYAISDHLKKNIAAHGYTVPTSIQEKTIPRLLENKDVIGIANTGTGKTAAFLIPLIHKTHTFRSERVLIVVPTRELAMQIVDEFQIFSRGMDLSAVLCIGGANIRRQESNLSRNPHFVIGTPGRLKDLINRKKLRLELFQNIVLDEVDRMVDIGFIKDIQYLISLLPKKRQSLFFSATVSGKASAIIESFVTNAVTISVKTQPTSNTIEQDVIKVKDKSMKLDALRDLLIKEGFEKVLIFGQTKWGIEKLTRELIERGFRAASIHGNKSQGQRQRALAQFKENRLQILLATDVASRGLDIDDVTHVINYDLPDSYDDYIHRIGRTGRAGKRGMALTFVE